ncbi:MAG: 16S rRNA (cytosine(1402)-N(4))-methyltransferase RsmH [Chitinispirillaceae bacterium]|nr:16S rRNA (cytosine(1402)-N(4))-methyltransferase RsmH [Chitinispirillaceae bacterium]
MEIHSYHIPVLADMVCNLLCVNKRGIYVDVTLGGGGHLRKMAEVLDREAVLVGIDRDSFAIEWNQSHPIREGASVLLRQGCFSELEEILASYKIKKVDGIFADLGVSSFQIDNRERGFSFMQECSLDMRMNPKDELTAKELLEKLSEEELSNVLDNYGEIHHSKRMAKAIKKNLPINTSFELRECLRREYGKEFEYKTVAKIFMALRIAVNDELNQLKALLESSVRLLNKGGRIGVISYHSLEDRIVKDFFRDNESRCICPVELPLCNCGRPGKLIRITKKPILPSEEEIKHNRRARSARLRVAERI